MALFEALWHVDVVALNKVPESFRQAIEEYHRSLAKKPAPQPQH
jgi:hypothetical protein